MNKEKEIMVEALIRYYIIELAHYDNAGMFEDIDAIISNLAMGFFGKRDFDYREMNSIESHIQILNNLLSKESGAAEDFKPEKEFLDIKDNSGVDDIVFCEVCSCNPCDCN